MAQQRCTALRNDGSPCNGPAYKGGAYCWFHAPETAQARDEGRRAGGSARSNRNRVRKEIEGAALSPAELEGYVAVALRGVLTGTKAPGVGSAVAALTRAAVAIRETVQIEERLIALESALATAERDRRRFGA